MLSPSKPMRPRIALEARATLTAKQVEEFAAKARWQVHCDDTRARRARCLDGRYKPGAGVIAMPGADVGVLALGLMAASWIYGKTGKEMVMEEVRQTIFGVVGGAANFSYHTDRLSLSGSTERYDGCSYCRLLSTHPKLFAPYALDVGQLATLHHTLEGLEREHVKPDVLRGGHDEMAVLLVQNVRNIVDCVPLGPDEIRRSRKLWVLDNYAVLRGVGRRRTFVYQRDLAEARILALADALGSSVKADADLLDRLRVLLQNIAAVHISRTLRQLARGLPAYNVYIDAVTGDIGEPERVF